MIVYKDEYITLKNTPQQLGLMLVSENSSSLSTIVKLIDQMMKSLEAYSEDADEFQKLKQQILDSIEAI